MLKFIPFFSFFCISAQVQSAFIIMKNDQVCATSDPAFKLIYEKVICPYQFPALLFNKIELDWKESFPVLKFLNNRLNALELKEEYKIQYVPDTLASMAVVSGVYQIKMEKRKKDLGEAWSIPEIVHKGLATREDSYKVCLEVAEKSLPVYELLHDCLAETDKNDKKMLYKEQAQIKEEDWVGIYRDLKEELYSFESLTNMEHTDKTHEEFEYMLGGGLEKNMRDYVFGGGYFNPEQRVRSLILFLKKDFFEETVGLILTLEKNAEEKGKAVLFRSVAIGPSKALEDLNVEGVCRSLSFGSLFQGFLSEPNNPRSNCPLDRHIKPNKKNILYALPLALNDQAVWEVFFVDPIPAWMQPFGYLEMHSRTRVPVKKYGVPLTLLDAKWGQYGINVTEIPRSYGICAQPPFCISEQEDLVKHADQVVKLLQNNAQLVLGDKKNFEISKATMTVENVKALKGIGIGEEVESQEYKIF
jgi:hypothetical protein